MTTRISAQQLTLLGALLDHDEPPWRADELPPLSVSFKHPKLAHMLGILATKRG